MLFWWRSRCVVVQILTLICVSLHGKRRFKEMKEHPAQLRTRRNYYEGISSEKAAREAEAEETERLGSIKFF